MSAHRLRIAALWVALCLCTPARAASTSAAEDDIYSALLHWAVELSGYPQPAVAPQVRFVSQEFFARYACHGKRCHVWGWYPNTGHDVVYVHENVRALIDDASDRNSLLAASIIVHEFTHYLQAAARNFAPYRCEEALLLEREAYGVQNAYLVGYGRYIQVGVSMHNASCNGSATVTFDRDPEPPADDTVTR